MKSPCLALALAVLTTAGCFGSSSSGPPDGGGQDLDAGGDDASIASDATLGDGGSSAPDAGEAAVDAGAGGVDGATGDGSTVFPGDAGSGFRVFSVAVGGSNMCVVLPDRTVECCGYNAEGQLGNGTAHTTSTSLVVATGAANVSSIASSGLIVCTILSDSTAQCWGSNYEGELGQGTLDASASCICDPTAVPVPGLTGVKAFALGGNHTCALLSDGTVDCWGENFYGELGNGTTSGPDTSMGGVPCNPTPTPVPGITGATAITSGDEHTCAVVAGGAVSCWGANFSGQLGDGTMNQAPSPVSVAGLQNAVALAAGYDHTCALRTDGTVWCWGDGTRGQLGNGMSTSSLAPVAVTGLTNVTAISAAPGLQAWTTCALRSDGTVWCWGGNNAGQVGNGTMNNALSPVQLAGISGATAISVGTNGACAVLADGTLECWGQVGLAKNTLVPAVVSP